MDPQQEERCLEAIAVSACVIVPTTATGLSIQQQQQACFQLLEDLKHHPARTALAVKWIQRADPILFQQQQQQNNNNQQRQYHDITVPTKLLGLDILLKFIYSEPYAHLQEQDRRTLREAVIAASRLLQRPAAAVTVTTTTTTAAAAAAAAGDRILGKKLASVLEGLVLRDFPQRWTTMATDVFAVYAAGGLWSDTEPALSSSAATSSSLSSSFIGTQICLELLRLLAEDLTDGDFNTKISTSRRNDVVLGLNEIAQTAFLGPMFTLFAQQYPVLQQSKAALFQMHGYLIQNIRPLTSLSPDERQQYEQTQRQLRTTSELIVDTLRTLKIFCTAMPLQWSIASSSSSESATAAATATTTTYSGSPQSTPDQQQQQDFVRVIFHLLREDTDKIQIVAVECLENLLAHGKLDLGQWLRFVWDLPNDIQQANDHFQTQGLPYLNAERQVLSQQQPVDPMIEQLDYHRALSRMLSLVLSSHIAHLSANQATLLTPGTELHHYLTHYFTMLVQLLHHPSGRVVAEQLSTWTALLRDPVITKAKLLQPYIQDVLSGFISILVKIRWEDIEEASGGGGGGGGDPSSSLVEASWVDEEEYDSWMADLRSRASLLFKFAGNAEPHLACEVVLRRMQELLAQHGEGAPFESKWMVNTAAANNNVTNGSQGQQLHMKSTAVLKFEGFQQPLDNILGGIPAWAFPLTTQQQQPPASGTNDGNDAAATTRASIRESTGRCLAAVAQALVSWNPTFLWLKFRRASLLESLKFYWRYDPTTLLQGVDSLLKYLGLPDEWDTSTTTGVKKMSTEMISLKKKSGVALVSISKRVPHHLVPWLSQLSVATRSLLVSEGLVPLNQMHLYEFLSCVATAVEDPVARANFIRDVLEDALETLESSDVQRGISSAAALLQSLGVVSPTQGRPDLYTDPDHVKSISSNYHRVFSALNRLLSVGKRCNEAARQATPPPSTNNENTVSSAMMGQQGLDSPDDRPLSIQELSVKDPFAPLWPRLLPPLLMAYKATLSIWLPEQQAPLLSNQYQRYVYAISDDEAFLCRSHDAKSGGVFGEGGTSGSVIAGCSRRDTNLLPKWSGWFNELRNTCFQLFGLLSASKVMFAPELNGMFPSIVSVIADQATLRSMEHRHFSQFMKHVVELLLLSCPAPLYATHLEPILGPVLEHLRVRLEQTWRPITSISDPSATSVATKALSSADCSSAALIASRGGDEWYASYYARCGLFVGDLDSVTAEAAVEKYRVETSRVFSDILQTALAMKGGWALVLANLAREEQANKRNDQAKLVRGPGNRINDEGVVLNADGTPRSTQQAAIDARKLQRINSLCHFLLLENERIAGNLTLLVVQCLSYPDAYTCRRIAKVCHRMLETVAWSPIYTQLLGQALFTQAIKNIVTEPKWMVGVEWDMINVVRDVYCRLVLGQILATGGQGPGLQQTPTQHNANQYEQAKSVDSPLQGGGILTIPSDLPRQILVSLPGLSVQTVQQFERDMTTKRSAKDQKDVIRDMLRVAADHLKNMDPSPANGNWGGAAASMFDRAIEEESLLHSKGQKTVPDLPEKLIITQSPATKAASQTRNVEEPEGLGGFDLFGRG